MNGFCSLWYSFSKTKQLLGAERKLIHIVHLQYIVFD
jgi:hypothetical protein